MVQQEDIERDDTVSQLLSTIDHGGVVVAGDVAADDDGAGAGAGMLHG